MAALDDGAVVLAYLGKTQMQVLVKTLSRKAITPHVLRTSLDDGSCSTHVVYGFVDCVSLYICADMKSTQMFV